MRAWKAFGVVGLVWSVLAWAGCCGPREKVNKEPGLVASSDSAGARLARPWGVRPLESGAAAYQREFPHEELLPAPAFEVTLGPSKKVTIVFVRRAKGSPKSSPSWLGVIEGKQRELVPLTLNDEGQVLEVDSLDLRDTDGDGRPELLLLARFQPPGDPAPPPFRRGVQIEWGPQGKPSKTLSSHDLRGTTTITTLDELAKALDELHRSPHCPALSADMEAETTLAVLRCMVEGNHKEQVAASVLYPLRVLLPSGEVRELSGPEQFVEVYDLVIDASVREALKQGENDSYYGGVMVVGRGVLLLSQSLYVTKTFPAQPPKITAILSLDQGAHQKLRERMATDQRGLWQGRSVDVLCRTKRATHAFYRDEKGRVSLATWNDPKASPAQKPPDRLLFGLLESYGSCGNYFYQFVGPGGLVRFTSISCSGPEPAAKHSVVDGADDEACLNHPMLR